MKNLVLYGCLVIGFCLSGVFLSVVFSDWSYYIGFWSGMLTMVAYDYLKTKE